MTDSELAHELNLLVLRTRMTFRQTIQRILKSNNVDMTFEMLQVMHCLWQIIQIHMIILLPKRFFQR